MLREGEGSGATHAREQQAVAEEDLEAAVSRASATGTDVERDENVETIYEDAINKADKGRSLVHGALNSCAEPVFMILVGVQLFEVSQELSEVETEDQSNDPLASKIGAIILIAFGAIFSFGNLFRWFLSSMNSDLEASKTRSSMAWEQALSMLLTSLAAFFLPVVKTKIIEDPSNVLFLAIGTFTDVVDYWAGVKATLKAHEHGAYTFPLTQVSPLLFIVIELFAAPVTLAVGLFIIVPCGFSLLIVFCCLSPILYITRILNGARRSFVENFFLVVAILSVKIIDWGTNLAREGPSSRKLNAKIGIEILPEDAVNLSRVLNAYGIYADVLMWVVLFTNLSAEFLFGQDWGE